MNENQIELMLQHLSYARTTLVVLPEAITQERDFPCQSAREEVDAWMLSCEADYDKLNHVSSELRAWRNKTKIQKIISILFNK